MVFINITSNTFTSNLESILLSSTRTLELEIFFSSSDDFYQLLGNVVVWKKLTSISIINIDKQDNKIGKIDINTIDKPLRKKLDQEYLGSD